MSTKRWRQQRQTEEQRASREHGLPLLVHALLALTHQNAGRHGQDQQERIRAVCVRAAREAPEAWQQAEDARMYDLDVRAGRNR